MCQICDSAATVLAAAEALTEACIEAVAQLPLRKVPGARRLNQAFKVDPATPTDMMTKIARLR